MPRVEASSGSSYLGTISGERYAFTLLINNFTGEVSSVKAKIVRIWNKMVAL
jgi:hypothetical protein